MASPRAVLSAFEGPHPRTSPHASHCQHPFQLLHLAATDVGLWKGPCRV